MFHHRTFHYRIFYLPKSQHQIFSFTTNSFSSNFPIFLILVVWYCYIYWFSILSILIFAVFAVFSFFLIFYKQIFLRSFLSFWDFCWFFFRVFDNFSGFWVFFVYCYHQSLPSPGISSFIPTLHIKITIQISEWLKWLFNIVLC